MCVVLRKMNLTRGIDLTKIANMMTTGSGAELKGVCTEAGMFALRERRVHVTQEDFEMAVTKVMKKVGDQIWDCMLYWQIIICTLLFSVAITGILLTDDICKCRIMKRIQACASCGSNFSNLEMRWLWILSLSAY
jgi:hypothetical protein